MSKDSDRKAIYGAMGSIAFIGVARSVLFVVRDPASTTGRRYITRPKANYLPDAEKKVALAFTTIEAEPGIPVIAWEKEVVAVDIDTMLAARPHEKTEVDRAAEFMKELFKDVERVAQKTIMVMAKAAGLSEAALRRGQKRLGLKAKRISLQGGSKGAGEWYWIKMSTPEGRKCKLPHLGHVGHVDREGDQATMAHPGIQWVGSG